MLAPVLGQQVVQDVVHGHHAEQAPHLVDDGQRDEVVRRQPAGDLVERGVGADRVDVGVDDAADGLVRRLPQHPLDVHHPQEPPGGGLQRWPAHEDGGGQRRRQLRAAHQGQRLGDRRLRGQHDRVGRHQAAGGLLAVGHQPPDVVRLVRLHRVQEPLLLVAGQLREQVGGVVRLHRLQDVGRPVLPEPRQDLHLVVLGQLLQHVGEPVVVELGDQLALPLDGQVVQQVGDVGGLHLVQGGHQQRRGLLGRAAVQPGHVLDVEQQRLPAAAQASGEPALGDAAAHVDLRDVPVVVALLLQGEVLHDGLTRPVAQLHRAVEQLAQHERLGRALLEAAQVHQTGRDDLARVHAGHPGHRDEHPAPTAHLDHEPDHPRPAPLRRHQAHDVADAPHAVAERVEDRQPSEAGREDTGRR